MEKTLAYKLNKDINKEQVIKGEKYRITLLGDKMLRIEYSPNGIFEDALTTMAINRKFDVPKHNVKIDNDTLYLETDHYQIIYPLNATLDLLKIKPNGSNVESFYYENDEYNLLGTYRTLDGANGEVPLEKGLFSLNGYTYIDDTKSPIFNDEGYLDDRNNEDGYQDLYLFFFYDDFYGGLQEYAKLSGKTPLIPRFALGNWWSRFYKYTEESLKNLMLDFKKHELPLSVCIIDMDWHITDVPEELGGGWTGYTFNKELFPNPPRMFQFLHDLNLKTALNLHPHAGIRYFDDCYPSLASAMGIDVNSKETVEFDIFNTSFIENYFKYVMHPYEDMGVDFWWIDWQQGTKTKFSDLDPLFQLNHLHYIDLNKKQRGLTFSRYPGFGGHRYPIGFSGDTIITFKSLAFQPYFTATASNTAYSWWSHDIGGHCNGKDDDELYIRWLQFGVFSPIFRLHSTNNEFIIRAPFERKNPLPLIVAKKYLPLRHKLIPYIYTYAYKNYKEDIPLIRPIYYEYPQNNIAYKFKNEYFFGDQMLVSPVITPLDPYLNVSITKVYLPKGNYYDFFTNQYFKGNRQFNMYSDIHSTPLFVREGSIIPLAVLEEPNFVGNPKKLEVLVYSGKNNSFTLYEDDGISNNYKQDDNYQTHFSLKQNSKSINLAIRTSGNSDLIPQDRELIIKFINVSPNTILKKKVNGFIEKTYDENEKILTIKIQNPGHKALIALVNDDKILVDRSNEFVRKNIYDLLIDIDDGVDIKNEIRHRLLAQGYSSLNEYVNAINAMDNINSKIKKALLAIVKQAF